MAVGARWVGWGLTTIALGGCAPPCVDDGSLAKQHDPSCMQPSRESGTTAATTTGSTTVFTSISSMSSGESSASTTSTGGATEGGSVGTVGFSTGLTPDEGTSLGTSSSTGGVGSSTEGGSSTGQACTEETVEAENSREPADILLVVSNVGSMEFEEMEVEAHMNQFAGKISASGVDAHVVLLSSHDICIVPPLGSGGCPGNDTKLPGFLHVDLSIGSNDALQRLLDSGADWSGSMRPDGDKHVIVVSDDDSDLPAGTFDAMFTALGPEYTDYKLHAIVAPWDDDDIGKCLQDPFCCSVNVGEGGQYMLLTMMTGGVLGALCDSGQQDLGGVFEALSTAIVADSTIACEWAIPGPMGMDVDFDAVNVDYKNGMGGVQEIPRVDGVADCADLEAWYYDEPLSPTKLFACPALCMKVQEDPMSAIVVKFGCPSGVPP